MLHVNLPNSSKHTKRKQELAYIETTGCLVFESFYAQNPLIWSKSGVITPILS